MYTTLLAFALIIAVGLLWQRFAPRDLPASTLRHAINRMVFAVFLPALCLHVLYRAPLGIDAVLIPLTAWASLLVTLGTAWLVYRLIRRPLALPPQQIGVLILAATFGNVTFLGLPVLSEVFGAEAARYALFFDLLAATPCLWLVGAAMAAHYGSGTAFRLRSALRTLFELPPVWACGLGIGLNLAGIPLPAFLLLALELLGSLTVPLMIFSVGLALRRPHASHLAAVGPVAVLKLGWAPWVAVVIGRWLGLDGMALAAAGIEGAMPTMVLTLLIADRFGLDAPLAATCIVVTMALALFTLPLTVGLLTGG